MNCPFAAALAIVIAGCAHAGEETVLLHSNFNRPYDAGKSWTSTGAVVLKDDAMWFQAKEEEFRPRARQHFPLQSEGVFTVSFLMDWLRTSEGSWALYMQLGNSAEMPRRIVYPEDLSKGIGVNLVWGGGEPIDHHTRGSLGYLQDGKFAPLFVVNDAADKSSLVEKAVVTIDANASTGTYKVRFNGKTYGDLTFDNDVAIDTIRFVAHGCSESGFSKSAIDDVVVRGRNRQSIGATDVEKLVPSPVGVPRKVTAVPVVASGPAGDTGLDHETFKTVVMPVLNKYCVSCHGAEKQKARLRYDEMEGFRISDRHLWTAIHEQLSFGDMPPEDEPQLSASEKEKVLAWIEKE